MAASGSPQKAASWRSDEGNHGGMAKYPAATRFRPSGSTNHSILARSIGDASGGETEMTGIGVAGA